MDVDAALGEIPRVREVTGRLSTETRADHPDPLVRALATDSRWGTPYDAYEIVVWAILAPRPEASGLDFGLSLGLDRAVAKEEARA